MKYMCKYKIGEYVNRKSKNGKKLYFAGVDNHYMFCGLPCVYLTESKSDLSNTNAWRRFSPHGFITKEV